MPLDALLKKPADQYSDLDQKQLLSVVKNLHGLYAQALDRGALPNVIKGVESDYAESVSKLLEIGVTVHDKGKLYESLPSELKGRVDASSDKTKLADVMDKPFSSIEIKSLDTPSLLQLHYLAHAAYRIKPSGEVEELHQKIATQLRERGASHHKMDSLDDHLVSLEGELKSAPPVLLVPPPEFPIPRTDWEKKFKLRLTDIRDMAALSICLKGKYLIDLGCGVGLKTRVLVDSGYLVTAIEVEPLLVQIATADPGFGLDLPMTVVESEALDYLKQCEDGFCDCVISSHLLEQNTNWPEILKEAIRVSKLRSIHVVSMGERQESNKVFWRTPLDLLKAMSSVAPDVFCQILTTRDFNAVVIFDKKVPILVEEVPSAVSTDTTKTTPVTDPIIEEQVKTGFARFASAFRNRMTDVIRSFIKSEQPKEGN